MSNSRPISISRHECLSKWQSIRMVSWSLCKVELTCIYHSRHFECLAINSMLTWWILFAHVFVFRWARRCKRIWYREACCCSLRSIAPCLRSFTEKHSSVPYILCFRQMIMAMFAEKQLRKPRSPSRCRTNSTHVWSFEDRQMLIERKLIFWDILITPICVRSTQVNFWQLAWQFPWQHLPQGSLSLSLNDEKNLETRLVSLVTSFQPRLHDIHKRMITWLRTKRPKKFVTFRCFVVTKFQAGIFNIFKYVCHESWPKRLTFGQLCVAATGNNQRK